MNIYNGNFSIEYKEDKSPLTHADTKANEIICNSLLKAYPSIPILSEENKIETYEIRKNWEYFWLIDPLDGTKEFIKRNGEFTVNIALIHKNEPILGVVYVPVLNDMYIAKKGSGAFKNGVKLPLDINQNSKKKLTIAASKSHLSKETQAFIDNLAKEAETVEYIFKGSSLKLVMIAEGSADIYPRLAPTMEWDTAAADAIVRESGKMTYQFENRQPVRYNKENLLNPWFIVK